MKEDQETLDRFRMLLAADARIAEAEATCKALGLTAEAKKLGKMRAELMAQLEPIQGKAYKILAQAPATRQ
ncbi:MAG TPA: hypothetical protein VHL34_08175 [Rhizomicrobium sp.]|jgi:hypothetical protein|nr:hypothetical protein [Rhizomicrobium sp.]